MNKITIVGMGPGGKEYLTIQAIEALTSWGGVYLRTDKHPVVAYLVERGMQYVSFDSVYETAETFDETYLMIADRVIKLAEDSDVV